MSIIPPRRPGDDAPDRQGAEEVVPASEEAALQAILGGLDRRLRRACRSGPALRGAHPKAHGCVAAEVRVLDNLPEPLRAGVFARPRRFPAWIRFSNGSPAPRPDAAGDVRGMAIKLLEVEGSPSGTQDFLLISHPVLFLRDAADAAAFETSSLARFLFPGPDPRGWRLRSLRVLLAIRRGRVANPLDARYWSTTPFRFGQAACKFAARPCGPPSPYRARGGPGYLRENLAAHLAEQGAEFDFMVQLRTRPEAMPIEDPRIPWRESDSPPVPVARITIPRQHLAAAERDAFGEALSFTPWHCVEAHRPLGGVNRARRAAYEAGSALRHGLNGTLRREP